MPNINSLLDWLEDCITYGACAKCYRRKEGLCQSAKTLTERALDAILALQKELANAKGEKLPERPVRAQKEPQDEISVKKGKGRKKNA